MQQSTAARTYTQKNSYRYSSNHSRQHWLVRSMHMIRVRQVQFRIDLIFPIRTCIGRGTGLTYEHDTGVPIPSVYIDTYVVHTRYIVRVYPYCKQHSPYRIRVRGSLLPPPPPNEFYIKFIKTLHDSG